MPRELVAGRYEIVRLIAEGGMGSVYEARHVVTEQPVALKRLHARFAADEDARKRFLREMRAPAKIRHPGVCTIFDAGFDDGEPYIVMELLDGETLGDRLRRGVSIDEGLDLVERLLEPLAAAHASGVVHRDLKPENVFVAKDGEGERVKLLDFGIARRATESTSLTATGTAIGTPHYMSPEQAIDSKTVDAATDVWAVGVMLYEVRAGFDLSMARTPSP